MKTKIIVGILVLGLACLSGCKDSKAKGQKQNEVPTENSNEESNMDESNTDESKVQVYREPTEEELKILEDCNLSNDSMRKIKEEGMNIGTQSFVDTAKIMLNYLREKYGEEFKVVGGEIPGIISGDYSILAEAVDGEHSGEQFEVYYLVDDAGNPYCEDGYFAILKSAEVQEYLQSIAQEAGTDIKVIVSLNGTVGKQYNKDTTIEGIQKLNKNKGIQIFIHGYMRPEVSDEEFQKQIKKLEEKLKQTDLCIKYTVVRLNDDKKFDYIQEYSDISIAFPRGTSVEEEYNLRYHAYIEGEE
ncbi:hypothetical protein [Roseburia sp. MSJ-14]|uniref:hypothetical protein n=1 Tax=Roseburia sp. MSJ-14 TaxID=2841514 RepID=UPI001C112A4D|nr:hypothetical protein [Roseburia sp. MSJ-14]MBU5472036.1 hypothetical protein [Roseburia sp. MSJ-14]